MYQNCRTSVAKLKNICYNKFINRYLLWGIDMLSKSKYCAFVQCPKKLWLKNNKSDLAKQDTSVDERMDDGNEIGDLAMQLFGDFVEVTAHKDNGKMDLSAMISKTNELLLKNCPVICEASFSYNGNYCAVDILKKENDGYAIYEVKSSSHINSIYITDIAYQKYVLEHCGVNVTGTYLIHINSAYIFDGTLKLDEFFKIVDVSEAIAEEYIQVEDNISAANDITDDPIEPIYDLFDGCHNPYDCEFFEYCSSHLPKPSVFDLYGSAVHFDKKIEYYKKGIYSFEDLSKVDKIMKSHIPSMQINHELYDLEAYVDKRGIKKFLNTLWYPLYFLDFETMQPCIPQFVGTKPYMQIPFQYSLHYIECEGGELKHKEFLGISGEDPRRAISERLCEDIPKDACVIVYNKTFEQGRLAELAECFPDLAEHLLIIRDNVRDLRVPFQKGYYYNRAMGGSFSIKCVLPAVFPGDPTLDYHNLEGVHNGDEAKKLFPKIKDMSPKEQEIAYKNLLKYCELDTYATVKLWEALVKSVK